MRPIPRPRLATLLACLALAMPGAVVAQDTAPERLPQAGTILEPGRYVADDVGPAIEFRVEEGWVVGPSGNGPIFTLEYLQSPGTVLSVTRFDGETFLDSCDPSSMAIVEATVPRLTEIVARNPFLNAGPPDVIEVDGYRGLWFDVGVPRYDPADCGLSYVLLWALPIGDGGEFVQVADQQSRFLILDIEGDVIVIAIESFPGVPFGGLLDASMELVRSMRIEPGEYVPPTPRPSPAASATPPASTDPSPRATAPSPGPSPTPDPTTDASALA